MAIGQHLKPISAILVSMHVDLQAVIILLVVLMLSMSVHEMMHAFASDWLGDDTARLMGRLTLNPLPHIDPVFTVALPLLLLLSGAPPFGAAKPVPINFNRLRHGELGMAIVGIVGPLTNLVIALVAAIIFNHAQPAVNTLAYDIFYITIVLNSGLFIFNMIPWPPLDGSRVLYAFAPRPLQEVMERIEGLGMIGLVFFVFVFYSLNGSLGSVMNSVTHFLAPTLITQL